MQYVKKVTPNFAFLDAFSEAVNVMKHLGTRDAELDENFPRATHRLGRNGLKHSFVIPSFMSNSLCLIVDVLQPEQNFLNNPVTLLWSIAPSPIAQQMILVALVGSNS